jgi:RHS repeat-associated protein
VREYVWLDDMPLAVVADVDTASPQLWFVHADHLDRPVKMTHGSKAVVWDAVYRPFGEAHAITGSASNNLRFPGQYFLIESGLHYNWHRHYDPTIGRYLQADPLSGADVLGTTEHLGPGSNSTTQRSSTFLTYGSGLFRRPTAPLHPKTGNILSVARIGIESASKPNGTSGVHESTPNEFIDGPSLYSYAQSRATTQVDPRGLLTGLFTPIPSAARQCTVTLAASRMPPGWCPLKHSFPRPGGYTCIYQCSHYMTFTISGRLGCLLFLPPYDGKLLNDN